MSTARALYALDRYDEALIPLAAAVAESSDGGAGRLEAEALLLREDSLVELGKAVEGLASLDQAQLVAERAGDDETKAIAQAAGAYERALRGGAFEPSWASIELALAALGRAGNPPRATIEVLNLGCGLAFMHQHLDQAEATCRRALALAQQHEERPTLKTARAANALSRVLARKGDLEGALPLSALGLEVAEHALGATHPNLRNYVDQQGNLLSELSRFQDALPLRERACRLAQCEKQWVSPGALVARANLGETHLDLGHFSEALVLLSSSAMRAEADYPAHHPYRSTLWLGVGRAQ